MAKLSAGAPDADRDDHTLISSGRRQIRTPRTVHYTSPGQGQGEVKELSVQGRSTMA